MPPEARAKWLRVVEARTLEEKISALEEFISAVPKHKGTEKLLHWARRRLSELREEQEERRRKRVGGGSRFFVEKEGAAQVVLVGGPDSGKSALLSKLTGARSEPTDYPFSTKVPVPGMLFVGGIPLQLVDTPSLVLDNEEGPSWRGRVIGLARNADAILLVVDLTRDAVAQVRGAIELLSNGGVLVTKPKARVTISKISSGGINVVLNGKLVGCSVDEVKRLLREYGVHHAIVRISGEATIDEIENSILRGADYKPTIILANKVDVEGAEKRLEELSRAYGRDFRIIPVSAATGRGLDEVGPALVEELELIRVYTKQPNGEVSKSPLVLRRGATVLDVAKSIHSSLWKNFKYARVWGRSVRYPGERVGASHLVEDGDVVEIHARG
ncbi:MAG: TGS domain-containing protein [Fervidicoccaceae archaeon]